MRSFIRDRLSQVVIGMLVATFVYCVLALPRLSGEPAAPAPAVSMTMATVLAVVTVVLILAHPDHLAHRLQVGQVVRVIADEGEKVIDALDEVRRQAWNDARALARAEPKRGRGRPPADAPPRPGSDLAKGLKGARYSLWKNPDNLTENQQVKLAWIAETDPKLYRAYLLKEGLRVIFQLRYQEAKTALDAWVAWARRCRIPAFVKLQKSIVKHRARILAAIEHNLSNGLIESTNTKIRLITRIAFGFKSAEPLIGLAMLSLGGHKPVLPGRK